MDVALPGIFNTNKQDRETDVCCMNMHMHLKCGETHWSNFEKKAFNLHICMNTCTNSVGK
jgi:hypothetical protein